MKIFVSYTLKDNDVVIPIINMIIDELGRQHQLFIDIYHNDSQDKQLRVMTELKSSDIIILVKTPNLYNSQWVLKEIYEARNSKIPIIEICDNNTEILKNLIESEFTCKI